MTASLDLVKPGFLLEILNGGAITPGQIWLVMIAIYLSKEAKRRGLRAFDWFHLPPSMDFMLAVFIGDLGVEVKAIAVWVWRRFFDAGDFSVMQTGLLMLGSTLIVLGFLCKIRALTKPDCGNGPYLKAAAWTVGVVILLLIFR